MRKLAGLLLALSLGACSGDGGPTEPESVSGTYVLQSIDGRPLPVTFQLGPERSMTIKAGVVMFEPFINCESALLLGYDSSSSPMEDKVSCYYEQAGATVALNFKTPYGHLQGLVGVEATASLDGRALTIAGDGHTLVYRRQ